VAAQQPVSRDRVVAAAVAIADADGLPAVSMRSVSTRLGVVPMALYKHVANKDDLVVAMVDSLVAQFDQPGPGAAGWQEQVRQQVLSARRVLAAHPWGRPAIEAQTTRTPQVLRHLDTLTGAFLGGGLSADPTHHAMHALGHRTWGFSPEAFQDPGSLAPPADPAGREALLHAVQQTYPHIAAVALDAVGGDVDALGAGCDEQFEFEFALDLLLDAVERLHQQGWTSRRSTDAS